MNKNQIDMMERAIKNGRYYTDANDKDWRELVEKGYATQRAGWDERSAYYIPTSEGKAALKEFLK